MIVKIKRAYSSKNLDSYKDVLDEYNFNYIANHDKKLATIDIETVKDLFILSAKLNQDLVISNFHLNEYNDYAMTIYDGYMDTFKNL